MSIRRTVAVFAVAVAALAGCSSNDSGGSKASADKSSTSKSDAGLTTSDAWVKSAKVDQMMTAVFVNLKNTTDKDIQIVSATTDMSPKAELHEMIEKNGQMIMQEVEGGLKVPAGETLELKPGGFHVMVMSMDKDVVVGQKHKVTLTLSDKKTIEFEAIVKDFAGANEKYDDGSGNMTDHSGMTDMKDHSGMSDGAKASSSHGG